MDPQRPTQALDRLAAFEHGIGGSAPSAAQPAAGSPGLQFATSIVLPGLAALRRRPLIGILLFTLGVAVPVVLAAWVFSRRDDLIGMALDQQFLSSIVAVGAAVVVARVAAVTEVAVAFRGRAGMWWRTSFASLVALALAVPVGMFAMQSNEARTAVGNVFGDGDGSSIYVPENDGADDGVSVDPEAITNILLLGGDAGPGRWGMRTDTMILVSIHDARGRTALLSIPRNLTRLRFPPGTPMAGRFPDGFDAYQGLTNAVFTYVSGDEALMSHYGEGGRLPQPAALAEGIGYSLDVEIDDYSLVNMQGFTEIIDAVGGVTLELSDSVALPPSLPGERELPSSIGPGMVEMDGAMAIAYVRSRSGDSDYSRMGRQRQLLAALGSQVSGSDAVAGFSKVTGTLDDSMRTSLSGGEFSDLLDRLGDNAAIGESIGLTPPLIEPGNADYDEIRRIVDAVQNYVLTGTPSGYAT